MISVSCTCGRRFKAEDHHAGKRTRCPVCGSLLVIPQAAAGSPSGISDNGEVPSWWFPTAPGSKPGTKSGTGPSAVPPTRSGSNPDDIQTVVMPPQSSSKTDLPTPGGPLDAGSGFTKRLIALGGGVLLLVAAGFALISWPGQGANEGAGAVPPVSRQPPAAKDQAGSGPGEPAPPEPTAGPSPTGSGGAAGSGGLAGSGPTSATPAGPAADIPQRPPVEAGVQRPPAEAGVQLLVPAYFYPAGDGLQSWQRLIDAADKARIVTVANPANGPGDQRNPDYFLVTQDASDRGVRVIGYIPTNYAKRPLSEIKNEIDRWIEFYPHIRGFFIDQQSPAARDLGYYIKIRNHARQQIKAALVVTNPGSMCSEEYFIQNVADVICVFANFQGFAQFDPPAVLKQFSSTRFAALVYNIPSAAAMRTAVKDALLKHIGYLYVGDAPQGANPYAKLPAYWDELVDAVARQK